MLNMRNVLLGCGIGYGIAYIVANDVVAAPMVEGYSRMDQAISELSGTAAPSRAFLTGMLPVFTLLVAAFGIGVWLASGRNRWLRITGAILVAQGLMFPLWLLFPMTSREELAQGAGGLNDVGHMVLGLVGILFIVTEIGTGAAGLGTRFRYFSVAMVITVLAAGGYVATTTSEVAAGDPTPWMGLVERVSYGGWLLWMAVLGLVLMRRSEVLAGKSTPSPGQAAGTRATGEALPHR